LQYETDLNTVNTQAQCMFLISFKMFVFLHAYVKGGKISRDVL